MSIELNSDRAQCSRCGVAYGRRKGNFPVSYSVLYKGMGYIPVCKDCIDTMYNTYLAQCGDARDAVHQMCRKLDLFWSDKVYNMVAAKNTPRSMMTQYIAKTNTSAYIGKSYDDTLLADGTMWTFRGAVADEQPNETETTQQSQEQEDEEIQIASDTVAFWGPGYTPKMYIELEQRRSYWMSRFPSDMELDIGTEALIRQICSLEIDINRDRAAGRSADKSITALNTLLGSANLKPAQRKQEDVDAALASVPMGVWLYRYENKRPLPEIDDDLKDVNGIKRYIFTWFGHVLKMLGVKNKYSQLYDEEIERLRVERPEYDGDDDELFFSSIDANYTIGGDGGE